ncbi:hypothetical protein [Streptomyces siamensis]|uniref:Uncharacterized protein n=1 Tax=Streptomyces siamensis TaxID=1274986 RepID=A0ABP9JR23_9ACTN
MNHTFARRAASMAATAAVAAATLLAVGGTASATSDPSADRTAAASHSFGTAVPYGDNRGGDRDRDREGSDRYGYDSHHKKERNANEWRRRHSYDGHRKWERNGTKWHHNNNGQGHSYDSHRFHRWNADKRVTVGAKAHGLNDHTSR